MASNAHKIPQGPLTNNLIAQRGREVWKVLTIIDNWGSAKLLNATDRAVYMLKIEKNSIPAYIFEIMKEKKIIYKLS